MTDEVKKDLEKEEPTEQTAIASEQKEDKKREDIAEKSTASEQKKSQTEDKADEKDAGKVAEKTDEAAAEKVEDAAEEAKSSTEEPTVKEEKGAAEAGETEAGGGAVQEPEKEDSDTEAKTEEAYVLPTFTGEVGEKVYRMEELEEASEEYDDDQFNQMVKMYEGTLTAFTEKEIVTGRVLSMDEKYVIVDIGFK